MRPVPMLETPARRGAFPSPHRWHGEWLVPRTLPRVVADVAAVRGFVLPMAVHAGDHRDRLLLGYYFPLRYRAVARFARQRRFLVMHRVREPDVVRQPVDAHPRHRLVRFRVPGKLPDGRAVCLDGGVAAHAGLLFRQARGEARLLQGVTVLTLDA